MKSKGFTLIELLAVIVILAIIALIATPIILNIIGEARKESVKRSAENYVKAVETAVVRKNFTEQYSPAICLFEGTENNKTLNCYKDTEKTQSLGALTVEVDGETAVDGTIVFENGKIKEYTNLTISGQTVTKDTNGTVTIGSTNNETNKLVDMNGNEYEYTDEKYFNITADGKLSIKEEYYHITFDSYYPTGEYAELTEINIPPTVNGINVQRITGYAAAKATVVRIPEGVTAIEQYGLGSGAAMAGIIDSLYLPSTLQNLGGPVAQMRSTSFVYVNMKQLEAPSSIIPCNFSTSCYHGGNTTSIPTIVFLP